MATILYALSGQGRGHTSRVTAVSDALRRRGHDVVFCCGGTAREILEARGEAVVPVPALRQVMRDNEVRLAQTVACNVPHILRAPSILNALTERIELLGPDLVITDFEAFAPRAAARAGVPVLSFNHQQVVTEMQYDLPRRYRLMAAVTSGAIRLIAPRRPEHVLVSSFFYGNLKRPERTTLVPPIIRPEVQQLAPREGDKVVVYYNQTEGAQHVIRALSEVDASFVLYNFGAPPEGGVFKNLTFKKPCMDGFARDLAESRAVICTAGFTLISESLYLRKPLLVVPNRGIFEQTLNAIFLERNGMGEAVIERPLQASDVQQFLEKIPVYRARMPSEGILGNRLAVDCIERLLSRNGRCSRPVPPDAGNGHAATWAPTRVAKAN